MIYISRVEGGVVDSGQYCNKRGKGVGLTLAQQRRGFGIYIKMTQGKLKGGKMETATNGAALTLAKHQRGSAMDGNLGFCCPTIYSAYILLSGMPPPI